MKTRGRRAYKYESAPGLARAKESHTCFGRSSHDCEVIVSPRPGMRRSQCQCRGRDSLAPAEMRVPRLPGHWETVPRPFGRSAAIATTQRVQRVLPSHACLRRQRSVMACDKTASSEQMDFRWPTYKLIQLIGRTDVSFIHHSGLSCLLASVWKLWSKCATLRIPTPR